jgi:hypothetical protein
MRTLALALSITTLAGGCGASSSLEETQPVVVIPDDSKPTSPSPPSELAPANTELDVVGVEPPRSRDEVTRAAEHAVKSLEDLGVQHFPSGEHCITIECR